MKLQFTHSTFLQYLQLGLRFVSSKPQLPVLSCFCLETVDDKIFLSATDLQIGIKLEIPGEILEPGKAIIPAKLAFDICQQNTSSAIELRLESNQVVFTFKSAKAKLTTYPTEDFPQFPDSQGEILSFSAETITQTTQLVSFAASFDETRPIITSILLFGDELLHSVATDGYRLATLELPYPTGKSWKALFPSRIFPELGKVLSVFDSQTVDCFISLETKQAFFDFGTCRVVTRLLEGDYPPYQRIIPRDYAFLVEVSADEFEQHIKSALLFSRGTSGIVKLQLSKSGLTVSSNASGQGDFQATLAFQAQKMSDQQLDIAFNGKYLLDFLQRAKGQQITLGFNESTKPGAFRIVGQSDYLYVVMPFRLSEAT